MCQIIYYTDGAVSGNGNKDAYGGWAWFCDKTGDKGSGSILYQATNQICELCAVIEACYDAEKWLEPELFPMPEIVIRTDSAYIYNCWKDKWYKNWQQNGWKNSKKEPVANQTLWNELIEFFDNPNYTFEKVKGHDGEPGNEMADRLACKAKARAKEMLLNNE